MSTAAGYEDALAGLSLVVGTALLLLFVGNMRLYPIAQREPVLVAVSNLSSTILIAMWLFEAEHDNILYIHRKIISQLCFGLLVVPFFVRAWKLFLDAGLANERVKGKVGWFITHRVLRSRRCLAGLGVSLFLIQVGMCFLSIFTEPEFNLVPANVGSKTVNDALVTNLPLVYWIIFIMFSFLIARTRDGFHIKQEMAAVGAGSFTWAMLSRLEATPQLSFGCTLPDCNRFLSWIGWLWLISCSVIFPITFAVKDPRWRWTRCLRPGRETSTHSRTSTRSSRLSSATPEGDFPSEHGSRFDVPELQHELSDRTLLRLRDIPLSQFLTYPAGREAFRQFTVREFSVENLLFVEAVKLFRDNPLSNQEDFRSLYNQFIAQESPNQVNLTSATMQKLSERLDAPAVPGSDAVRYWFDEAASSIMRLMQRDAFKRFQNTDEWEKHISVFDKVTKARSPPSEDGSRPSVNNGVELATPSTTIEPNSELVFGHGRTSTAPNPLEVVESARGPHVRLSINPNVSGYGRLSILPAPDTPSSDMGHMRVVSIPEQSESPRAARGLSGSGPIPEHSESPRAGRGLSVNPESLTRDAAGHRLSASPNPSPTNAHVSASAPMLDSPTNAGHASMSSARSDSPKYLHPPAAASHSAPLALDRDPSDRAVNATLVPFEHSESSQAPRCDTPSAIPDRCASPSQNVESPAVSPRPSPKGYSDLV